MADDVPRPVAAHRFIPLGILVLAGTLFMGLGGHRYVTFAALDENREWLVAAVAQAGAKAAFAFIFAYAGLVALSVPGAALLTIAGGILFGPWLGTAYAVTGATLGATIVFLAARAGLAGLTARAGPWVRRFEAGFRDNALNYLLVLRLIPIFPFWLVNLVAGAVGLPLRVFLLGTVIGMIPATLIYASLGNTLGTLAGEGRPPDIGILAQPRVFLPVLGLAALALLPVVYKSWRTRAGGGMSALTPDLCIIGAGSSGLAVAAGAVQMGASVVLVERGRMGGDCLNYGCVPSKSLLAASRLATAWRHGAEFGVAYAPPQIDFAAVVDSVGRVIVRIAPNDSVERFEALGVRVIAAEAHFVDRRTIRAGDSVIRPRRFVIATGSAPVVPPIPGLDSVKFFTNETIFANRAAPAHLIVIGGGPIGIELAQAHLGLGAAVTVIDAGPLLPRDDPELVALLAQRLTEDGAALKPSVAIAGVERAGSDIAVTLATGERITGSHLLVAAGRRPNLAALDLPAAGIAANAAGIVVDRRLRTTNRRAFAVGDAAGGPQFTHVALYHAGIVIRNALFRLPARVDYRALPWVTYTDPELAQVGLSEAAARAAGHEVRVLRWSFADNDRAHTERDISGEVKIIANRRGRILGATILGAAAGDLILPWALAISQKLKIGAMANLVVPYPTRGEAGKRAAGSFYTPTLFAPRTRALVRLLARFG